METRKGTLNLASVVFLFSANLIHAWLAVNAVKVSLVSMTHSSAKLTAAAAVAQKEDIHAQMANQAVEVAVGAVAVVKGVMAVEAALVEVVAIPEVDAVIVGMAILADTGELEI